LFYLGLLAYGDGQPAELKQACGLFLQSASTGHPGGMREYGECQLRGSGSVRKDPGAAADWFRKSIAHGGVEAYVSLARLYKEGQGVPQDEAEAGRLLEKHAGLAARK
jgi:uncharacterized protein